MAQSVRLLYRGQKGTIRKNHNWAPIKANSAVVITAAEFSVANCRPLLGAANVYVTNIGPHDPEGGTGGVEFLLHVDWETPLDVIVTITVLGDIDVFQEV
ncbi:hypothetical protein [Streptomyces nitrosporeus]|uniref:hypothetical protein n=1 Tax=Streptomyces nitrosporeus TaxID=28894 RepID=UPI00331D5F6A